MKKLFITLTLFIAALMLKAGIVEKTYYFSAPKIISKGEYQKISFANTMQTNFAGYPSLPYYAISLLLPPGEKAIAIKFIGENETGISGKFILYPHQPSRPLNDTLKAPFIKNKKVYMSTLTLPINPTGKLKTAFMNGHGFALSAFTPLKYTPSSGQISYYKKVTIKIITTKEKNANSISKNLKCSTLINNKIRLLAQNPEMLKLYKSRKIRSMSDYRLLIITGANYINNFDSLRNIYLERGLRSKVYSVSFINSNISGQDLQEKIRNFIIQEYQNHGVDFVLLGGDVEIVPYRGFYCYVHSGAGYESNDIPADLYYSALDGTWNDDGDDRWGEPDEDDLLPDVSVARMPFSNNDELSALIHKSIWYQNKPVLGEFTSPLLAGEFLYANPETWGSDYLNLIIGTHSDNGYTTTGIPPTYNIDSMYEKHQSWSGNDLINEINQGKEFVHHVGHANETYVAHLYNSDITDANFYAANGVTHNYTLLHTHGCDCGAFDYNDCILERMVNIHNFAAAVIGNSRYGWFNEGQTEGPAAHLHRETVNALFHDSLNMIGRALVQAKIATAPWVEAPGQWEEGALRWNFYDLNILGDPAMSVWTNEPITVNVTYNPVVTIGTDSISVHVANNGMPMHNFTCSILKDNALLGYGFTDSVGNAWIVFDSLVTTTGSGSLVVVGYNCLPDTNAVNFIATGGPYIIYSGNTISDSLGNNNGAADFGETISLNVGLANIGSNDAHSVMSQLSTVDTNVIIINDTAFYGTITANDTVWKDNAFSCTIANNVPDQTTIAFQIQNNGDEGSWTSDFSITANAPKLSAGNITIDDSQNGNGNNLLDPGESALLMIPSSNLGHCSCDSTVGQLSINSSWITLNSSTVNLGTLAIDSSKIAVFPINVNENTPLGTVVPIVYTLTSGAYIIEKHYSVSIGLLIEDFETGDFSKFEWQTGGNAPWTITGTNPYQGSWCAKSGIISDNQHSDLSITLTTIGDDSIKFMRKVSSEQDYDFLCFYIDGVKKAQWSGAINWANVKYPVNEGQHTLLWSYEKDMSESGGSDCAWLDSIVFPATTVEVNIKTINSQNNITIFPNPSNGYFYFHVNDIKTAHISITVFDDIGKKILYKRYTKHSNTLLFNLSGYKPGLYFLKIKLDDKIIIRKIILK